MPHPKLMGNYLFVRASWLAAQSSEQPQKRLGPLHRTLTCSSGPCNAADTCCKLANNLHLVLNPLRVCM